MKFFGLLDFPTHYEIVAVSTYLFIGTNAFIQYHPTFPATETKKKQHSLDYSILNVGRLVESNERAVQPALELQSEDVVLICAGGS